MTNSEVIESTATRTETRTTSDNPQWPRMRTTHYETFHRWPLVPVNRFFGVYWHVYYSDRFLPPHDHPWWNVTIRIRGRFQERLIKNYNAFDRGRPIDSSNRRIVFRKATTAHAWQRESGPLWTIFIHGPEWNVAGGRAL